MNEMHPLKVVVVLLLLSPSHSVRGGEGESAAELDAVLQHHHSVQEKLAEDMLNLARNLKNNTMAAQNIIKQDNQVSHLYTGFFFFFFLFTQIIDWLGRVL